ncbi:MAG: sigma-E processing peptidase SpoIIGA [Clostridia bacterium]|nr:sigma-E processing peptidase SpoIIGA [Clostridia bacterium]
MRVYGEAYLLINFWMDFLSLLLAACLKQARFHAPRAILGAALGAVYTVFAWTEKGFCRGYLLLAASLLLISLISFGKAGFFLFPYVAISVLNLCGLSDALLRSGVSCAAALLIAGFFSLSVCLIQRKTGLSQDAACELRILYRGKQASLPAIRDSGNLLRDGVTGQPVIVVPQSALTGLIPADTCPEEIATLPPGWRLLPIRTASGKGMLMCFRADRAELIQGRTVRQVRAPIAVSVFPEKSALVPECLFRGFCAAKSPKKEVVYHAGIRYEKMDAAGFLPPAHRQRALYRRG